MPKIFFEIFFEFSAKVTHDKKPVLQRLQSLDSELSQLIRSERIIVMENGSGSPCINLASVPCNLVAHLEENHCDLIVLEGMGRAIHTNLHAKFNIGTFS